MQNKLLIVNKNQMGYHMNSVQKLGKAVMCVLESAMLVGSVHATLLTVKFFSLAGSVDHHVLAVAEWI